MTETEPVAPEEPDQESDKNKPFEKPGLALIGALALVAFLALLVFFANVQGTRASAGLEITKPLWTLQSYAGATGSLIPVLPGSNVTARFGTDGQLAGSSGCNRYTASYTVNDYGITVISLIGTQRYCTGTGVMQQEISYLHDLPNASIFRISEKSLNIYDAGGKPLLIYRS